MEEITEEKVRGEWYRSSIQERRELGMFALKTLMTLNSGGFVVLLTFLGNSSAQTAFLVTLGAIKLAMLSFLAGIVLAFLVIALAYVVALTSNPYTGRTALADWFVIPAYLIIAWLSLAAFSFAVWTVLSGVEVR
ncbi:hypothetical protein [Rhodovulum euryhalinum]|uniref:Uncharacterized protein n=1 Tax=Rhodovulum euryhalinum TaxID=35805 RepID=A0A4R2KG33_9RHOB|nr:hypothetical protein [Rhodovulum euryhalinum]TCO72054.1 hypothetical protein EV655_105161 [Rhodovulum euryhalinum]